MTKLKKEILFLTLLILIPTASARVTHQIDINSSGEASIESKILLESESDVNYWQSSWKLPRGATNLSVKDSEGSLEEIKVRDRTLYFNTSRGKLRDEELVTVRYQIPEKSEKVAEELHRAEFQLSGFRDKNTSVQVETPEKILGTYESYGYKSGFKGKTANFSGEGAVNIRVVWTPREGEYENYILFGEANLTRADRLYPVLNMVTGRETDFRKFAVIIKPDDEYLEEHNEWYAGTYENGGTIFIKESEVGKDGFTGLMLHEAMHGFNQRPLGWSGTNASTFDEGTAKYVEYLANHNLKVKQAEIFGEPVEWTGPCEDDSRKECAFRIGTRGTPEHLWKYYQDNMSFMKVWNPSMTKETAGMTARTFGYAYGELLMREEILRKNRSTLKHIYDRMEDLERAETREEYWDNLKKAFRSDLKPCYPNTREGLESCLEDINNMEPEMPENVTVSGKNYSLNFEPVEKEKVKESNYTEEVKKSPESRNYIAQYIRYLKNLLKNIFS